MTITQYFSKWRNKWVDFANQPTVEGEIKSMEKYKYEIRQIVIEDVPHRYQERLLNILK